MFSTDMDFRKRFFLAVKITLVLAVWAVICLL